MLKIETLAETNHITDHQPQLVLPPKRSLVIAKDISSVPSLSETFPDMKRPFAVFDIRKMPSLKRELDAKPLEVVPEAKPTISIVLVRFEAGVSGKEASRRTKRGALRASQFGRILERVSLYQRILRNNSQGWMVLPYERDGSTQYARQLVTTSLIERFQRMANTFSHEELAKEDWTKELAKTEMKKQINKGKKNKEEQDILEALRKGNIPIEVEFKEECFKSEINGPSNSKTETTQSNKSKPDKEAEEARDEKDPSDEIPLEPFTVDDCIQLWNRPF